ncbi:hypothetical protein M3Y97_01074800 [Aphelenchoides bicaudatus]|nr:hypothetical protein M3Y97_01074800 [Aphelenchoides bicaudatus]
MILTTIVRRECMCGVPVHSGTKIVMWIQIIGSIILSIFIFQAMPFFVLILLLNFPLCGAVLYGMEKKKPCFYKPYLFFTAIGFCLKMGEIVVKSSIQINTNQPHKWPLIFGIFIASLAITNFFLYLCLFVPYFSWRLLDLESREDQSQMSVSYSTGPQIVVETPQNKIVPLPPNSYMYSPEYNIPPPAYSEKA